MLKERVMDDPCSVNSPQRVLSLSRKRKETLLFPELDDQASGFGVSGEHGPKPSEVYGFVGSISTVVATAIFLIWAYAPDRYIPLGSFIILAGIGLWQCQHMQW
ncbi:hypothetical protein ACSBR2_023527 [Camellia fascicularis]